MFNKIDLCQVCRHYNIGSNQCSKAPKRAIPKSRCADYEGNTYRDLCKYCSHNNYGICTVQGNKCGVEPFLVNICRYFENKKVMDKKWNTRRKNGCAHDVPIAASVIVKWTIATSSLTKKKLHA